MEFNHRTAPADAGTSLPAQPASPGTLRQCGHRRHGSVRCRRDGVRLDGGRATPSRGRRTAGSECREIRHRATARGDHSQHVGALAIGPPGRTRSLAKSIDVNVFDVYRDAWRIEPDVAGVQETRINPTTVASPMVDNLRPFRPEYEMVLKVRASVTPNDAPTAAAKARKFYANAA